MGFFCVHSSEALFMKTLLPIKYGLIAIIGLTLFVTLQIDLTYYRSQIQIRKANDLWQQADFQNAAAYYQKSLSIFSNDPLTTDKYAFSLLKSQRYNDAIGAYQKLDTLAPRFSQVNYFLGECYRLLNNPERALAYYKIACQQTQDGRNFYRYAQMLQKTERQEEAFAAIQKAIRFLAQAHAHPFASATTRQVLIDACQYFQDFPIFGQEKVRFLEQIVGSNLKNDFVVRKFLAQMLYEQGSFTEAQAQLENVLAQVPDDAGAKALLGHIYIQQNHRSEKAGDLLESALNQRPDLATQILPDLISYHINRGDSIAVEEHLRQFYQLQQRKNDHSMYINALLLELAFAYSVQNLSRAEQVLERLQPFTQQMPKVGKTIEQIEANFR